LFASYLRPERLQVPGWREVLSQAFAAGMRNRRHYFGLYPFRWQQDWEQEFRALVPDGPLQLQVAPVLERLVFPRCRSALLAWLQELASFQEVRWLIPAHYEAPVPCSPHALGQLANDLKQRAWAPQSGSWTFLAGIDRRLLQLGLVPQEPLS